MIEIPKSLKTVMKISAVIFFIASILYIAMINIFLDLLSLPAFHFLYSGIFGGTLLIFGILTLLVLNRDDITQAILFLELIIIWEIMVIIINIYTLIAHPYPELPIFVIWVNNVIFLIMTGVNIYFYRRYR